MGEGIESEVGMQINMQRIGQDDKVSATFIRENLQLTHP